VLRQAVILAGGKGTRLRERLVGQPKPLVDVLGVPLLERQVLALRGAGVSQVLVLVNHEAAQIERFVRARDGWGIDVQLIDDGAPRGTAGAVLQILDRLAEEFFVVYGDTLFEIDFARFQAFHAAQVQTAATLFVHPNDHPADSDIVVLGEDGSILRFSGYPHPVGAWLPNMVNAALYIVRREALRSWSQPGNAATGAADGTLDFAKHLFPAMLLAGQVLRGYASPEYIKDIGTPRRLDAACAALANGLIGRASLRQPQKAVFLDRDGCLNVSNGHIATPEALEVFDFAAEAVRQLHDAEYRTVLVTNQPVVARGDCTLEQLDGIHAKLETVLGSGGAFLDRLLFCPHHPDRGFAGEVSALKIECACRKPQPGMLLQAAHELNIVLADSWMVGDSTADLLAARRAGVSSVLVATGEGGQDGRHAVLPDFEVADVLAAARFITSTYPRLLGLDAVNGLLAAMQPGSDWLLCGQARSGKTTLAQTLARELRRRGQDCTVISLDRWIRPTEERTAGFEGRHDLAAIASVFEQAGRRHAHETVELGLPIYRRQGRRAMAAAESVRVNGRSLIIWEGVSGFSLLDAPALAGRSVFVDSQAELRRERVLADLRRRGDSAPVADSTWAARSNDEMPRVEATRERCALRVNLDGAWAADTEKDETQ